MEINNETLLAAQRRTKLRKIKKGAFYTVLISVIIIVLAVLIVEKYFILTEINVSDTVIYSKEEIIAGSGLETGMKLLSIKPAVVTETLKEKFPFLLEAEITRKLPQTVNIELREERGPMYISVAGELFALSPELDVISRIDKPSAFGDSSRIQLVANDIKSCIVGQKLVYADDNILDMTLQVYDAVASAEIGDKVSAIDLTDKFHITLMYEGRFRISLGNSEDLPFKTALFKKVAEQLYETDTGEIDVSDIKAAYVRLSSDFTQ